jgi:hypothetical protein
LFAKTQKSKIMKFYFFIFSLLTLPIFCSAQLEFGVKGGIHTYDLDKLTNLNLSSNDSEFTLTPREARYGYHLGIYTRLKVLGFFIEPSAIFNSTRFDYDVTSENYPFSVLSEDFLELDIPVLIGFRFLKVLRIQGGPVAHISLNSASGIFDINGEEYQYENMKYGFQAGAGIDLWRLRIDAMYESNFSYFANHISVDGTEYSFDNKAPRFIFTIGYRI